MEKTGNGFVVIDPEYRGGSYAYWNLSGTVQTDALIEALQNSSVPKELIPKHVSMEVALSRACMSTKHGRKFVVHRMKKDKNWVITSIREDVAKDDPEYKVEVKAKLNAIGRVQFTFDTTNTMQSNLVNIIQAEFNAALDVLDTVDISHWIVKVVLPYVSGACVKDKGGIYFVPRPYDEGFWTMITSIVQSLSQCVFYTIPVIKCDQVVKSVLDGLSAEAEQFSADMHKLVTSNVAGHRRLENAAEDCKPLLNKLKLYSDLLQVSTEKIQNAVSSTQTMLSAAAIVAQQNDDE